MTELRQEILRLHKAISEYDQAILGAEDADQERFSRLRAWDIEILGTYMRFIYA